MSDHEPSGESRLYTLREAAEVCGLTLTAMRKRADRGHVRVVLRDGVRLVPHSELERAGLLPDARVRELEARVGELERELSVHRRLAESTGAELEAERAVTRELEAAVFEARGELGRAEGHAQALEELLGGRGWHAWRRRRRAVHAVRAGELVLEHEPAAAA